MTHPCCRQLLCFSAPSSLPVCLKISHCPLCSSSTLFSTSLTHLLVLSLPLLLSLLHSLTARRQFESSSQVVRGQLCPALATRKSVWSVEGCLSRSRCPLLTLAASRRVWHSSSQIHHLTLFCFPSRGRSSNPCSSSTSTPSLRLLSDYAVLSKSSFLRG